MLSATVHNLLEENLADGGRVALVAGSRQVTYAELAREVGALAAWLADAGVRRGDRVVIHLLKSIEEVVATLAVARLGAVFVNVNHQRTTAQLAFAAEDAGARLAIVEARRAAEMQKSAAIPASIERILVRGKAPDDARFTPWSDVDPSRSAPVTKVVDADVAALLYTSGSTGRPKGVVLSHLNVVAGARSVATYLESRASDRVLSVLPFSFDYGLNQLTTTFLVGATLVLQPVSLAAEVVKVAREHACTGLACVPPLWIPIVRALEATKTTLSLRYATNSGGAIPPGILRAMPDVMPGARIFLMYGLTEAFRSTFLAPELFHAKMGSIGKAIPNAEVFVIREGEGVAGPGEEGELVHRGSLVSLGYWNQPEATAAKIKPCPELRARIGDEKVCYSGDRVRLDEDGLLWFVGRTDAMIKCSGHRISPTEVEDVVYESRMIGDCVAFGVKDDDLGEVVHVAVSGLEGAAVDEGALLAFCRRSLPSFMVPARVHVWSREMPRNANGKLDRPMIVAESVGNG